MTRAVVDSLPRRSLSQLLADKPTWSLKVRLVLARRLVLAVQALHRQGKTHRALHAATVTFDRQFQPLLGPPAEARRFGGDQSDPEFCPPELAQGSAVELPAEIDAATELLRQRAAPLDPRRVDVYQLGVLLCQLLTGEPFLNYLYSPTCKAKVPSTARAVLESCLGENPTGSFVDCDVLLAALTELIRQIPKEQATSTSETPPLGSAVLNLADTPAQGKPIPSAKSSTRGKLPFERLGHFQIVDRIGSGGMGDVYKGYDASLDRYVALKVLAPILARDEEFVRRFSAEATAVAKLFHPNVVPIYFIGEGDGHHFFAMQFIAGQSLSQCLSSEKRLPVEKTIAIIEQCLAGLDAAHVQGLIHRDVKPGNILLEQATGRAVLVDFGLVRHLNSDSRMTATGVVMGTVDYVAPEQARGQPVDGRSDIYSVGVMFYELLAGRLPFISDSPTAMIFQHAYEEPFPLKQAAPHVPQPVVDIIAHMMAKDPAERYPSCAAVLADLRAFREGRPVQAVPASKPVGGASKQQDGAAAKQRDGVAVELPPHRLASKTSMPASVPDDDLDPNWDADFAMPPSENPLQRAKDMAATMFRRYAPQQVQEMQGTTVQMDAAVAQYERRRNRLASLLKEGRGIEADLSEQIKAQLAAAAEAAREAKTSAAEDAKDAALAKKSECEQNAASLRSQRDVQRQEVEDLERQLNKADATLARLRNQQNMLKARLQAAEARRQMEGGLPEPKRHRRLVPLAVGAGLLALVSLLLIGRFTAREPSPVGLPIPVTPTLPFPTSVTEGVGRGGFRVGATREELTRLFGPPDTSPNPQDRHARWIPQYHVDCLIHEVRGAFEIRFDEGFHLPLASGIRIGSAESEVLSAYGSPSRVVQKPQSKMLEFSDRGVLMWIMNGRVFEFTVFKPYGAATAGALAKKVDFVIGPHVLQSGDNIVIEEVWSELGSLGKGDTVTVKGTYTLASHPKARLCFYVTRDRGDPPDHNPGVTMSIEAGSAPFELKSSITSRGHLHLGFYGVQEGNAFGNMYFGTAAQMQEIASWNLGSNGTSAHRFPHDAKLTDTQRQYRDWTEDYFAVLLSQTQLQNLSASEQAVAEEDYLKKLSSDNADTRISAINALAVLGSKRAVPDVLHIAAERVQKDNRDRWMAIRALGFIGDMIVVPDLVHLTYHYNKNARLWAQISLVRLTGENFADDVSAWSHWWKLQGGTPPISEDRIDWKATASAAPSLSVNGLADMDSIAPTEFPSQWRSNDVFANITTPGRIIFPTLPVTAYVLEAEVALRNLAGHLVFHLGDCDFSTELNLGKIWDADKDAKRILCRFFSCQPFGVNWNGGCDYEAGSRLKLKIVVPDGLRKWLYVNGRPELQGWAVASDVAMEIRAEGDVDATIYSCALRNLTEEDVERLGLEMPQRRISVDPDLPARLTQEAASLGEVPEQGSAFRVPTTGTVMNWINPGEFVMGTSHAAHGQDGLGAQRVRHTKGYWIGRYQVTQGEWERLMGNNPSRVQGSPYLPVNWINWVDAAAFCRKLTDAARQRGRIPAGYEYRLPTEAEWEYACAAGTDGQPTPGTDSPGATQPKDWKAPFWRREFRHEPPNAWGLCDMLGIAPEWCADAWRPYPEDGQTKLVKDRFERGALDLDRFVVRGGFSDRYTRFRATPKVADDYRSFRLVLGRELK